MSPAAIRPLTGIQPDDAADGRMVERRVTASGPLVPDRVAGRYEVIRPLGAGGFGRTVLARDTRVGRLVAIKALKRPDDLKALELFEREAAVLPSLRHAGIPEVYEQLRDVWEGVPTSLLVMEYIEGRSLAEVIEAGDRLDQSDVLHLMVELLSVLEYLHGRMPPVLHRDIKPANLILGPAGAVTLVDFGAVRAVHRYANDPGSTVGGT
jgi:serine/threonine protein kinase